MFELDEWMHVTLAHRGIGWYLALTGLRFYFLSSVLFRNEGNYREGDV